MKYMICCWAYMNQEAYTELSEVLDACDVPHIVAKYNKYTASKPEFNKQGACMMN